MRGTLRFSVNYAEIRFIILGPAVIMRDTSVTLSPNVSSCLVLIENCAQRENLSRGNVEATQKSKLPIVNWFCSLNYTVVPRLTGSSNQVILNYQTSKKTGYWSSPDTECPDINPLLLYASISWHCLVRILSLPWYPESGQVKQCFWCFDIRVTALV